MIFIIIQNQKGQNRRVSFSIFQLSSQCLAAMPFCVEREINFFLWVALISVTAFLLGKLLKIFELWVKARRIPGPPCTSLYGHGGLISRSNLNDILYKCHEKYGGVVKLWLCPTQLLVSIEDTKLIKEVLLKAEDKLPLTGSAFHLAFGQSSLFLSSFDKVEHQRKSLEMKLGYSLLERTSLIPAEIFCRIVERDQSAGAKGGTDCETISQHLGFTLLGVTLFGDEFPTWPKATAYEELLIKIAKDVCFWSCYGVSPFWKEEFRRYEDSCTKLKCLTMELIKECRSNSNSGFLLDCGFHDDMGYESCGEIVGLMLHGTVKMAAFIANILSRLVTHLDIQEKIYSEIVMAQSDVRKPDESNVNLMPNLLATVYESARTLPAGPLLQRCSLLRDLELQNGVLIPAGAIIVVPVQLVQMKSSNWGSDASKFNPGRFLSTTNDACGVDQKESFMEPNELDAFLPFGAGARSCIGQKLAILGITSLLPALIKQYKVMVPPGSESNMKTTATNSHLHLPATSAISFMKRSS